MTDANKVMAGGLRVSTIYGLTDPRDGAIRYIGKANNAKKRLAGHLRDSRRRRTPVYAWINKLRALGMAPGLVEMAQCEGDDWKDQERRLIAEHRPSGRLLNVAEGGDEPHCPVEVRRENGRGAAKKRNELVFWLMCRCGQDAVFFEERGDTARATQARESQDILRQLSPEQRERFAERWKAEGNWWPGKARG